MSERSPGNHRGGRIDLESVSKREEERGQGERRDRAKGLCGD